jgi:hypothetical protein
MSAYLNSGCLVILKGEFTRIEAKKDFSCLSVEDLAVPQRPLTWNLSGTGKYTQIINFTFKLTSLKLKK